MKNIFLLIVTFFIGFQAIAQEESVLDKDKVYSFVEQKASPKEGLKEFYQNFVQEFKSPSLSRGVDEVIIRLKFIVEKDGTFSNIEVIDDKQGVGKEAKRVLKTMHSWNAAVSEGQLVRSSFTLPIKIKVNNEAQYDERVLTNKEAIKNYLLSLESHSMTNDYFEFSCNCGLYKSSKSDKDKTEEFFYEAVDKKVYYNIVLRKVNAADKTNPFEAIVKDVEKQNGQYRKIIFNNQDAMEVVLQIPNGDYVNQYRTIFVAKESYFIAISVVSYNKQIVDLVFNQLKQDFVLKI